MLCEKEMVTTTMAIPWGLSSLGGQVLVGRRMETEMVVDVAVAVVVVVLTVDGVEGVEILEAVGDLVALEDEAVGVVDHRQEGQSTEYWSQVTDRTSSFFFNN